MARGEKSFYEWCIDNKKEDYLDLWDYELNGCTPKDVDYASGKKYSFKCPRGLHNSEEKRIADLTSGSTKNLRCNCCNSFEQWCIDNEKEDWLDLWDYKKNGCSPKGVAYGSNKKYFFKCSKGLHDSEEKMINSLTNGNTNLRCNCCNSFGQWCIDNEKEDWLNLWDYELNGGCTPKDISYSTNKKYFFKCDRGLHDSEEKMINTLTSRNANLICNYCNSFEQWCIENKKEDYLDLWDYELNGCTPKDVDYASGKKYSFKCPRGLHNSEEKLIYSLTSGQVSIKCNCCNSFGQWCIDNGKEDWLDLWDYELNGGCTPKDISYANGKKYYFKCPRGLHNSEQKMINNLTNGHTEFKCNYCNSFEQWCIENGKEDWLDLWDYELNGCTPKDVDYGSGKKYYFKCERELHDSEQKMICRLTNGHTEFKCNCCNSFGQYLIDSYGENALEKYWDYEKNGSLDPFEIPRCSMKKVWLKCQEDETHDSYFVTCANFTSRGRRCPICKESHGERKIREYLTKNNIEFIAQKTFPKLLGVGKQPLSYDFYIPSKNLLVEFQGGQHYKPVDFNNEGMEQAEKNFEKQQEHDKRKREYAQQNNIDLLEISYIQEDKIEEILDEIFK